MGATGLGLLLEEHRSEIGSRWRRGVERELGLKEPALAFALAPLLREMSLAFGGTTAGRPSRDAWVRCAVLVRSSATPAQLAREFRVLHRAVWDSLRDAGAPVGPGDRVAADEWLQEALAEALERLERVRIRAAAFEHGHRVPVPPVARVRPPPLPPRSARPPGRASEARPASEAPLELEPISVR